MDVKNAIAAAKNYLTEVYSDEDVTNLGLEEIEFVPADGHRLVTIAFSRPWNTPRTRAQEVLETLGAFSPLKRTCKVIRITNDGEVLSMKNRERAEVE